MPPNNVTPLNPKPRGVGGPSAWQDPRTQTLAMYGLGAATFLLFVLGGGLVDFLAMGLGVAVVVICISKRDDAPAWARSHFEFTLRSMIIAGAVWTLASLFGVLPLIGGLVAFPVKLAVGAWLLARCAVGAWKANDRKLLENPTTLLL